ncbi:uncharacterized protein EI90DRAFT_3130520 [Cantharellus anzutake]|uniref:uncharacterized protein n=1 Tax=Cantharellus anzutake TaxID=1750568 RepID=UPI001903F016|nr:uncharacterized protein EI90DRAFT_3130520 [Cantharellus anzutake]KAF8322991.1 hypothetical protein EI90DRAFT_3130520 [Cantharellus anzutake]
MACESSEYGGYPIGDWAGLSYDILTGDLLQALQDYVQAYLVAVQANPMYQQQLHLPKHQQVPVLDPPDVLGIQSSTSTSTTVNMENPPCDAPDLLEDLSHLAMSSSIVISVHTRPRPDFRTSTLFTSGVITYRCRSDTHLRSWQHTSSYYSAPPSQHLHPPVILLRFPRPLRYSPSDLTTLLSATLSSLHYSSTTLPPSYDLLPLFRTSHSDTAHTLLRASVISIALVTSYYVNTIANIPRTSNPASVTSVSSATPELRGPPSVLSPPVIQLVIIPTSPHPPAPLGLALSTSFRTYHRSCPMTFGTAPLPLPFVPVRTSSFRFVRNRPEMPPRDFLLTYCEIKDQMDKQQWHSAPLESLRPRSLHAKSPIPLRSRPFPPILTSILIVEMETSPRNAPELPENLPTTFPPPPPDPCGPEPDVLLAPPLPGFDCDHAGAISPLIDDALPNREDSDNGSGILSDDKSDFSVNPLHPQSAFCDEISSVLPPLYFLPKIVP